MISIGVNKGDFNFINAVAKYDSRYTLNKVCLEVYENTVTFWATNTFVLVKKSFTLDDKQDMFDACVDIKFFNTIKTLAKKQDSLTLNIDTMNRTINCTVAGITITMELTIEKFPRTNEVYPTVKPTVEYIFTKGILEEFLKSLPNDTFVKFEGCQDLTALRVTTSNQHTFDDVKDVNLIMLVNPNYNR